MSDVAPEGERMAHKDWAGVHSAVVHMGTGSQKPLDGTNDNS